MQVKGKAKKVTIYIGESDKWKHKPLYTAILEMLKAEDCAGATVTRGIAGFGAHSRIHTASLVALSADLPLIIEWVDNPTRVRRVMPSLQEMVIEGLITVQNVEVVTYSQRSMRQIPATIPVQDIMSREVHAVRADTPLLKIIELLLDNVYRAIPVVDENKHVVGIVTEGNLLDRLEILATSAQRQLTQDEMAAQLQNLRRIDQTVAKAMTPVPIIVTADTNIAQVVKLMIEHDIKRLPVVNSEERLMGIVSRVDVLRTLSQPPVVELPRKNPPLGHHVQVGGVMTTDVPTVHADASLSDIIELLVSNIRRRVVVIDNDQRVVGIITDGDLIKQATLTERSGIIHALTHRVLPQQTDSLDLSRRTAAEVMTGQTITVTPETTLSDALKLLLKYHIKRLPVIDAEGKLVGMIGRGGILQVLGQATGIPGSRRYPIERENERENSESSSD